MTVVAAVRHRWRASLQLRVAATTLVLSSIVATILGFVILDQIRNGLLDAKTRAGLTQLELGLKHAAQQFSASDRASPAAVVKTATDVVASLAGAGSAAGGYGVVLLATDRGGESEATQPGGIAAIPPELRSVVSRRSSEAWTYTRIASAGGSVPSLVVGAPVPTPVAGYQLYYLFPLEQEEQSLALVQRTMVLAGATIVALLVLITVLVTRQVVRPVRVAAATAERLAAGRLRDRMRVRGEDDLASLAKSFNRMAGTVEQQILQLRELSRVQRRFVADVSHELRTPITTIRMAADVLHDARQDLPPELARSSELLQAQLDRFEALLADLLEISRHDAGAIALDAEPVDLRLLVNRVVDGTEPVAARQGCALQVDLPSEPVVVQIDARRIERLLRNLVVNALEHGAGRPVDVVVRGAECGVAVCVRDRGVGLSPGESSLVFNRFWRADPARARSSGGTGLGLSIALEDARAHGGWLQAAGEPGRGAVFRLTLPWQVGAELTESPLPLALAEAPAAEVTGA